MESSAPATSHHLRTLRPSASSVHSAAAHAVPAPEPEPEPELPAGATTPTATARLPPVDHGRAAYLFLLASFLIECILWGFPFSFGVLQEYYATHAPIAANARNLSAVGTTCSGIMYLLSPPTFLALSLSPHLQAHAPKYALPLTALAIFLSASATSVPHLLLTQGLLYGLAGCFLYYPIFLYIDEWFVRRKALAYGVMWAGSGSGGLMGPFLLEWGLTRFGARAFLRGWAVAMVLAIGPLLVFVRPRLPRARASVSMRETLKGMRVGFRFLRTREFWILQTGNIVQGLGYFIPLLYLPTYAAAMSLPRKVTSLLPGLVSISSIGGVLFLTALSDRSVSVFTIILISALGSALAVFLLWGFAGGSLALLVSFSLAYGFFAGGFTASYAAAAKELRRVMQRQQEILQSGPGLAGADVGSIFGVLSLGRGIGNVICGPMSELLLRGRTTGYGSQFGPLIVFTGVTMVVTLSSSLVKWLWKNRAAQITS